MTRNSIYLFANIEGVDIEDEVDTIQQLLSDSLPKLVQLKHAGAPAWPGRLPLHAHKHPVSSYQQHVPIPLGIHSFALLSVS